MQSIWYLSWFLICLIARYRIMSFIIYILNYISFSRYWWLILFIDELYIIISILFFMLESFVYIVIVVLFKCLWILLYWFFAIFFMISILIFAIDVYHENWMYDSIISIFSHIYENCCSIFSKFNRCDI